MKQKLLSLLCSVSLLFSLAVPALASSELKVNFIDVGQADSIFIELPDSQTMLIDAGTNQTGGNVVGYIRSLGYSKIDYLIGTHPHEDHIGGMDDVISAFSIGKVFLPKAAATTKTYEDVLTALKNKGLKVTAAKAGVNILNSGTLSANIIAPVNDSYTDLNNYSAVIKLSYGTTSFLFTGDAEAESEGQITADVKADVLKVGHHGSNSSTSAAFLHKVAPKYAVISVGTGNTYGHPADTTLTALKTAGVTLYRTDLDGTIVAASDGKTVSFKKGAADTNPAASSGTSPAAGAQVTPPAVSSTADTQSTTVYLTATGKKYHREGCRFLSKSKIPATLEQVRGAYGACSVCNPPA